MRKSHTTYSLTAALLLIFCLAGTATAQIDIPAAVPPGALEIQKIVNTRLVHAGDSIEYTLQIINNSENIINDLVVDDTLSIYAEYVDGSASDGGAYDPSTRVLSWDLGSLYGGDERTLTYTMSTDPNALDTVVVLNHAYVYNPRVNVKSNWTITWVKPIFQSVLSIEKSADQYTAKPGDTVSFNIRVENSGNIAAENIDIIDSLPDETEAIQNTITYGGTYDPAYHIIRWSAVSLEPGAGIDFGYKAVISSSILETTELDNIAIIPLPNDSSISDTSTITVTPEPPVPIITVDKIADRDTVGFGETIGYTIRVANSGTGAGENIEVVDVIPTGTEMVAGSITENGQYDTGSNGITWQVESVAPNSSIDLKFDALVTAEYDNYSTIDNRADLYFDDEDDYDTTSTVFRPVFKPELSIEKIGELATPPDGNVELPHFTITVKNTGNASAYELTVVDTLPGKDNYVWKPSSGGDVDPSQKKVTWNIDEIAPDEVATFDLFVMYLQDIPQLSPDTISNYVFMYHGEDIYSDTASVIIEPHNPKLEIIKEVNKAEASAGDTLAYTITANNRGNADAINVYIIDVLPDGVSPIDDPIGADGIYDPDTHTITWTIAELAASSGKVLKFGALISNQVTAGTVLENIALYDHPYFGASDTAFTTVIKPELRIDKTVDKPIARVKDTLNYTLVIENSGNAPARNIPVIDTLPAFTTLIDNSITQGGIYDPESREIRWLIETLPAEASRTLNFSATIDDNAVVGTGIINAGIIDLPDHPIIDTATTMVDEQIGEPKLTIDKTVDKDTVYVGDTLHYNIHIENVGNAVADAPHDYVSDLAYPPLKVIESSITNNGQLYDPVLNNIGWELPPIEPGEYLDLQYSAQVLNISTEQATAHNLAELYGTNSYGRDSTTTIVLKRGEINIDLEKTVTPDSVGVHDTVSYSITIRNNGETQYSGFLYDAIPFEVGLVYESISDGGYVPPDQYAIYWYVDNLAPGAAKTVYFDVFTGEPENDIDTVVNVVRTTNYPASAEAYLYVYNPNYPILTLDKTADKDTTSNNDVVTYTLTVQNFGGADANNVNVSDVIPKFTNYIENSASMDGAYDPGKNQLDWIIERIPVEGKIELTFQAQVDYTGYGNGEITNIGQIILKDSTVADTAISTVLGYPDDFELNIDKQVSRETARAGDALTYIVTVNNTGEGDAVEFEVFDQVPPEVRIIRTTVQVGGTFDPETGLITWPVDILAAGGTKEFSFDAVIRDAAEPQSSIMNIGRAEIDDIAIADTVYTEILPPIELPFTIVKTVDSTVAKRNSVIKYNIAVSNISDEPLSNIVFWDNVPEWTSYVDGTITGSGEYDRELNRVNWDWSDASIAPGHTINLSFKVRINEDTPKDHVIPNYAVAEIDLPDIPAKAASPALIDTVKSNTVQTIVNVPTGTQDDPVIVKAVNFAEAAPGNTLHYTVSVTNPGPDPVNPLIVSDVIPDMATYVAGSATRDGEYTAPDRILGWTYGPVAADETVTFEFDVTIDAGVLDGQEIHNTAYLVAPIFTPSNEVITTVRVGEFFLIKRVSHASAYPGDTLAYTLIYNNGTGVDQANVRIYDVVNADLDYVPGSATQGGSYQAHGLVWDFANIPAGTVDSVQFRAVINAEAAAGTSINNYCVVNGDNVPLTPSNEVFTTVLALPEANVVLIKRVVNQIARPGDTAEYRIEINNNNDSQIDNTVLVDILPEYFTYIDGSARVNGGTPTINDTDPLTFELGSLGAHEHMFIWYRAVIDDDIPLNQSFSNSAILTATDNRGRDVEVGPVSADVYVGESMLRITKSTNNASGTIGSVIPFTITIENISQVTITNIAIHDSMSAALDYLEGSSYINGAINAEPSGNNPYTWLISEIDPGETIILTYSAQLTTAAGPGTVENVAWAEGSFGTATVRTENVVAKVDVFATIIPGSIRGRLIVDCDGDKITEYPDWISDVDIYLEDGSMSRTNEKGMFYLSTVRAGTHIVAVDTRDLESQGFRLADGEPSSVFVHVNEAGETYVYFRVCPMISLHKEAGLVPKIKVTKTALLNREAMTDSSGVMVDYEIRIQSNEWYSKTLLKVVDSFPDETRLIIHDAQPIIPNERNNVLTYEVNIEEKHFNQSVYYSLEDLAPGIRRFLTNKIYLEGEVFLDSAHSYPIKSYPTEVQVGPFKRIPGQDIQVNVVGAYFESARARLLAEAIPVLTAVADTMKKYKDADIRVVGHCDWRPIRTPEFPSNWELSTARAKSVADWLIDSAGIARNRIEYEGMAATHPVDTSWSMKGMDRNRRVEVFVKSFREGKVDLSQITEDKWSSYTVLEIEPIDIDTLFKMPSRPIETGLADTWEVYLAIDAEGKDDIDNVTITDQIPAEAEYVEGSAEYAGQSLTPEITSDAQIIFHLEKLIPDGDAGLTYRIRTAEGNKPSGGGKAVLTIEKSGKIVNSNPVLFENSAE